MPLNKEIAILVVDDSGTMRNMFKQMLTEIGFTHIVFANDGLDAIEKMKTQIVELILSDWNMPNMDGLGFLKWLRNTEKTKQIPFIMATAQGDKAQEALVKEEKGDGHIAKPFDAAQLKDKIEEVLGLKKQEVEEKRVPKVTNGKVQMKIGHIQITDHLALGVLKHKIKTGEVVPNYFDLEAICMPGWNPVQQALEKGDIDGAFVLAPIAMDLFAFGIPIKLVSLAHKNGSSFVRNKSFSLGDYESIQSYYKYKVVNIPHKMSVHNMLAHIFLSELGLKPGVPGEKPINVRFEVIPPIKMPEVMKENDNVAGFIVAEPIASNAIAKGIADLQFTSASLFRNHPCCVVAMRDEFLQTYSDAAYELTSLLVDAGKFIERNKSAAAEIAVGFLDPQKTLGLTTAVLNKVLEDPDGIKMNDLYPVMADLDSIQQYMHNQMSIGKIIDLEKFVDFKYINAAANL